jgi:hypothetical protein
VNLQDAVEQVRVLCYTILLLSLKKLCCISTSAQPVNNQTVANFGIALVKARRLCIKESHHLFYFVFCTGVSIQDLTFARQALYHWNHAFRPFFVLLIFQTRAGVQPKLASVSIFVSIPLM